MIKQLYFIILMCISSFIHAQDKNLLLIGGEISGMYSSTDISNLDIDKGINSNSGFSPSNLMGTYGDNPGDYKTTYIELSPNISYYLTIDLLVGLGFDLINEISKYDSDLITKSKLSSYQISPRIRYYIYEGLYTQVQYNTGKSNQEIKSNNIVEAGESGFISYDYSTNMNYRLNGFGISIGYSIPLGNKIISDVGIKYLMNKYKAEYENKNEEGTYDLKQNNVLISFGLKYILKKSQ